MKSKLAITIITSVLSVVGLVTAFTTPTFAACSNPKNCVSSGVDSAGGSAAKTADPGAIVKSIVNVLLFIIGAVAVIMIIIGGIRYTVSQGDQSQVSSAKNTILYAVIGLLVAIFAYAIVNFVVTSFVK
jgi:glucose uptake protein GlcU